jgi:ATP-dependent helicase HrpA
LIFTKEKLFEELPEQVEDHRYPEHLVIDGQVFDLSYKFAPGSIDDGLTVDIPIESLAGLRPEGFDWLVEGMRLDLVTELIRSLPKAIRKNVVPAADWAAKVIADLPNDPSGSIHEVVAASLQKLSGQRISVTDFDLTKIPVALKMTYRVIGAKGKEVALDTDLRAMQIELAKPTELAVAKATTKLHASMERQGIETWDLGDLQLVIESEHSGKTIRAYPGLTISKSGIDLRVFATERDQLINHNRAVAELIKKQIPSSAKYIASHLKQEEKLAIAAVGFGSVSEFEDVRDQVNSRALQEAFDAAALIERAAKNLRDATKAISNAKAIDFLNELSGEKQHIADLTGNNLISSMGLERLARLPVYFAAIKNRVEKLQDNPAKDRLGSAELSQAFDAFEKAGGMIPLPWDAEPRLVQARWLIEELRVSLFAQQLGTSETVSVQRIKKVLAG